VQDFTSPRAWAFAIIGLHEYLRTLSGDLMANQIRAELAQRLRSLYETVASQDWLWFEDVVAYDNARLPHALMLTGRWANQPYLLRLAQESALARGTRSPGWAFSRWFQWILETR
jgi:hypothetical protein